MCQYTHHVHTRYDVIIMQRSLYLIGTGTTSGMLVGMRTGSRMCRGILSVCRAKMNTGGDNKPIFNIVPNSNNVTLDDVEDALIMCKGVTSKHGRDMCLSVGIDYDNAMKYYTSVRYLENCYKVDANWNQRVLSWNMYVLFQLFDAVYSEMAKVIVSMTEKNENIENKKHDKV